MYMQNCAQSWAWIHELLFSSMLLCSNNVFTLPIATMYMYMQFFLESYFTFNTHDTCVLTFNLSFLFPLAVFEDVLGMCVFVKCKLCWDQFLRINEYISSIIRSCYPRIVLQGHQCCPHIIINHCWLL